MMVRNEDDLYEKIETAEKASEPVRGRLLLDGGRWSAYNEGFQWEASSGRQWFNTDSSGRLTANYNMDAGPLRVTNNITTSMAVRKAAETYMAALEVECRPSARRTDTESAFAAQVAEDAINNWIGDSHYVDAARSANTMRPIYGSVVIGLCLETSESQLDMDGVQVELPDRRVRAFADAPHKLVLDPSQISTNLHTHDEVGWRDVWTYAKCARVWGDVFTKAIVEKDCQTVGEIAGREVALAMATDGRLMGSYWKHSRAKGVIVRQWHCKDESGRFSMMYVVLDGVYSSSARSKRGRLWINQDSPYSPFGSDGLPLEMLHGYFRPGSPFSMSDVQMTVDNQNRMNVSETTFYRAAANFSASRPLIHLQSTGENSVESALQKYNNRISGPLFYSGSKSDVMPPDILTFPPPPATFLDASDRERLNAMDKVSRPPVSTGEVKSHTSTAQQLNAQAQADMPGNVRVSEDIQAHQRLLRTLLGTQIISIKMRSPGVLASLYEQGFGPREFAALSEISPYRPAVEIRVMSSSVRFRPHEQRKADLLTAVEIGADKNMDARAALARDLDNAIFDDDKAFLRAAERAAMDVVRGAEWTPKPIGPRGQWFINAFQRAMLDPIAEADPATLQRLSRAVILQQELMVHEAMQANPELAAQAQSSGPSGASEAAPEATGSPVAISDALAASAA